MLKLTRQHNQGFWLGKDIFIKIMRTTGNVVHVGIEAPRGIPITREEHFTEGQLGYVKPVFKTPSNTKQ